MIEVRVLDTDERYDVPGVLIATKLAHDLHRENPGHWVDARDIDTNELLVLLEPVVPRLRGDFSAEQGSLL